MRTISFFAITLFSTSLLSVSYHVGAIGVDSASHGLIYDGRVVRRYGDIYKGFQKRAIPPEEIPEEGFGVKKRPPTAKKITKKPLNVAPTKNVKPDDLVNPPPPPPNPNTNTNQNPSPIPKNKGTKQNKAKTETNPTDINNNGKDANTANQDSGGDQDGDAQGDAQGGTPEVATGGLTTPAIFGIVSVGGVFVLVGGLFAFNQRKKNKEITKSIVSSSAKAWEHQNPTYETIEDEPKPIGSYKVTSTYTPTLPDELDIQPGDTVTILIEYDDGWVQGINETRGGTKGVFPRHCVDMDNNNTSTKNNHRTSSMGGFTEGYTEVDLN